MTVRYLLKRFAQAIVVVWAAFTGSFIILYMLPSDPVSLMLGDSGARDPAAVEALRAAYGFDQPVVVQYFMRLLDAIKGDLGVSYQSGEDVVSAISTALPETLKLTGFALVIALFIGFGIAMLASYTRSRWLRQVLLSIPPITVSMPVFFVGLILLQVGSFNLKLFPAMGNEGFESLVLPALTLAIPTSATLAQLLSKSMMSTLREPYIVTARAKGVSRQRIHIAHALQNAAMPVMTMFGIIVGGLIAGAVVTETVFSRSGIGRLTERAVSTQDLPMVQGLVLLSAAVFVIVNLIVDLLYPMIDPRIQEKK